MNGDRRVAGPPPGEPAGAEPAGPAGARKTAATPPPPNPPPGEKARCPPGVAVPVVCAIAAVSFGEKWPTSDEPR